MYNFQNLGHTMSFTSKVMKHIHLENEKRVRDYLICGIRDGQCNFYNHPCPETLQRGINFLKSKGWQVKISPNGNKLAFRDQNGKITKS